MSIAAGQKVNKRFNRQLKKLEILRRKLLNRLRSLGFRLTVNQIINPESSAFDEILLYRHREIVPRMQRLEAIRLWQLKDRAIEEKKIIQCDISSTVKFFSIQLVALNFDCEKHKRLTSHYEPFVTFYKFMLSKLKSVHSQGDELDIVDDSSTDEYETTPTNSSEESDINE